MPFLVLGTERYALPIGETPIGGTGEDAVPFPELAGLSPRARIIVLADGSARIEPVGGSAVHVNGVFLTAEGRRLVHGSRLDIDGVRILFGEIQANGRTIVASAVSEEDAALLAGLAASEGTASTGGRLTPRAGGKPCPIPEAGLDIGRDPTCGLVLSANDVSRRHARIAPGVLGYVLTDLSVNGVLVNGARVDGTRILGQGDVVEIGTEEWVFAADEAKPIEASPAPAPVERMAQPATAPAPPSPAPKLLASLEIINEGIRKGERFRIERPLIHIGRGAHNDIQFADDSVSSSHARLARRGAEWIVTDLGSTNGTYVDGARLNGDVVLRGPTELRFGGIKTVFRPLAGSSDEPMGTRVMSAARKDGPR
jgi:pSer/pThr/pTyr-binding forkhead associated (FHA) protein